MNELKNEILVKDWYFDERCSFCKRKVKQSTITRRMHDYIHYIEPIIGDKKVKDVTQEDIDLIMKSFEPKYKYGTMFSIYSVLTLMFRSALRHEIIESNPCFNRAYSRDFYEERRGCILCK